MQFEPNHIYHIYNRGNNSQQIFFNRKNYIFFLRKLKAHILPYADILAWCLMPNHFHLMIYVICSEIEIAKRKDESKDEFGVKWGTVLGESRNLIRSIAILLQSYTRAINN